MKLGIEVRDKITGFKGTVTGYVTYISGCNQALVVGKAGKDGSYRTHWVDEQRLDRVGNKTITLDNKKSPGFDVEPPMR